MDEGERCALGRSGGDQGVAPAQTGEQFAPQPAAVQTGPGGYGHELRSDQSHDRAFVASPFPADQWHHLPDQDAERVPIIV